jgi:predicted lipoprotein with Yx(FWY)xxD motif
MPRTRVVLLIAMIGALSLAGCGSNDSGTSAEQAPAATTSNASSTSQELASQEATASAPKGKTVKVISSDFGRVIADAKGEALYLFTKETGSKAKCYGACADAWPPLLTKGEPRAGNGAKESKLGTTKRRDGKTQVTYSGHPLYYYEDDSPGKILCQDVPEFGGIWYVVKPSGAAVT